jgi:hypothetical protein
MKKELKILELKKLFKEFGFLKLDEEYKFEIQSLYAPEFQQAVQAAFKDDPDLNLLFNTKGTSKSNIFSEPKTIQLDEGKLIGLEIYHLENVEPGIERYTGYTSNPKRETKISTAAKKLYRKIATKTHPDKVSVKYLNDLYLKAKSAYQEDDIFTLQLICTELDMTSEFTEIEIEQFKEKIKALRSNNAIVEQTYLWAWIHEENEGIRKSIILHFIKHSYKPRA